MKKKKKKKGGKKKKKKRRKSKKKKKKKKKEPFIIPDWVKNPGKLYAKTDNKPNLTVEGRSNFAMYQPTLAIKE